MDEAKRRRAAATIKDMQEAPSITAAWRGYEELVLSPQATDIQRSACRLAFWAGASVLFTAIMTMLDPGEEATEADLAKMTRLNDEILAFTATFDAEVLKRHGGER